ncbi:MAG: RNA methyltransferase [Bacteroidales bacterium]|nr:RNA methyltransferase [Bacteroidales bacterium]
MISKNKISELKKLSQKKFREERGLFVVEGTKSVCDLLASSLPVEDLFATEAWTEAHRAELSHVPFTVVTPAELERITVLSTPQAVLAVVRTPHFTTADLDFEDALLVLDGIRDPGNLGTILRTADWFGFRQVLCSEDCVEWTNPKTVQATMGSFTRVKVVYAHLPECLSQVQGRIFGTFMQGEDIQSVDFQKNDILVIGNEGKGISPEVEQCVQHRISVPLVERGAAHAESLNASIAAAIVMYEFRR